MTLLFKLLSTLISILGGLLAGAVFRLVWKAKSGEREKPKATSLERPTQEVLLAAALEGAIVGGVKAAVERAGARGIRHLVGANASAGSRAEGEHH